MPWRFVTVFKRCKAEIRKYKTHIKSSNRFDHLIKVMYFCSYEELLRKNWTFQIIKSGKNHDKNNVRVAYVCLKEIETLENVRKIIIEAFYKEILHITLVVVSCNQLEEALMFSDSK